ncbi:hypothetical protein TWF281_001354 [Arthrobotrys megalospora]
MSVIDTLLLVLTNLYTIAYLGAIAVLAFAAFLLAFIIVFIYTPGDFTHPYYEDGYGYGNHHSSNRKYRPLPPPRFIMPPVRRFRRPRGGMRYIPPPPPL